LLPARNPPPIRCPIPHRIRSASRLPKSYNRSNMQPAFSTPFPEPLPPAMPQLSEKPRHGVQSKNPAWHPGPNVPNSTVAIGLQFRCSETVSGPVVAPSNDMEYDIFHCPSCVNTWKQSDCVVNKPFNTVKDDLIVGATGAAFFGGVASSGTGAGSILKGAANYVGKEALGAVAVATTYLHAITSTAYALVAGCTE